MEDKLLEIRVEILKRRLRQADIAGAMSISESKLSRILNGRVEAPPAELERISKTVKSIGSVR